MITNRWGILIKSFEILLVFLVKGIPKDILELNRNSTMPGQNFNVYLGKNLCSNGEGVQYFGGDIISTNGDTISTLKGIQ